MPNSSINRAAPKVLGSGEVFVGVAPVDIDIGR